MKHLDIKYKYIPAFGIRKCQVYENSTGNIVARMYVDEDAKPPIAFVITITTKDIYINIPVELIDTNILGLRK